MSIHPDGPTPPRLPAAVPPAGDVELRDDVEWSQVEIVGDFTAAVAARVDIFESRLVGARFTGSRLERLTMIDTSVRDCDFSGALLYDATLTRVEFVDCRMSGFATNGARLQDVRFEGCRLDDASLRSCHGERICFERVDLRHGDFYAATISAAHFFDSDLTGVEFSQAALQGARLHGSTLEDLHGASYLKGVTIDSAQILAMALQVFGASGIVIDDQR